jgi:hypothetical protein
MLMIETEQPEGLSARKLVVETAKHNVLTAYSADDGIDILRRFPAVDAVLVHSDVLSKEPTILTQVRSKAPHAPIILASPLALQDTPEVTYVVDSHQPGALLKVLSEDLQASTDNR